MNSANTAAIALPVMLHTGATAAEPATGIAPATAPDGVCRHIGKYANAGYMGDKWVCTCGWESRSYFDGSEYAYDEWKLHVAQLTTGEVHHV